MHLPEADRFEAAKASMLRLGLFTWPDRELKKWCRESNHVLHAARQEAISERKAHARDSSAAR